MITKDNCSMTTITILDLVEQLRFYESWREVTRYTVVETFKNRKRIYRLMNLTAEMEAEYIMFDDGEGVLEANDEYVLNMFLMSSIKSINCYRDEPRNHYQADIKLNTGNIQIVATLS